MPTFACIKYKLMKTIILTFLVFGSALVHSQNIYTIAGNGDFGYSGDGYPAISNYVEFDEPTGIYMDASGNLYIADEYNNVIRKINTSGIISTVAGNHSLGAGYGGDNGQATDAQINLPCGVCTDASGNLYIADNGNMLVRMVNTSGIISTIAGNAHKGYSGDGGQATAAELSQPIDVFVNSSGVLYIAEYSGQRIRKVTTNGIISTIAGNGIGGYSGDGGQATAAEMQYPFSLFVDSVNNIYFTDNDNYVVRKVDTAGIISTIVGINVLGYNGEGGPATSAEIGYPSGIWMDKKSNIYFGDFNDQRVWKMDVSGILTSIAGNGYRSGSIGGYSGDGGPATAAEFAEPWGVVSDAFGNIYIADNNNSVIREILEDTATGINIIANNNNITVFPNPANNTLTINLKSRLLNGLVTLKIMDITGREVMSFVKSIDNNSLQIDITNLASGMYFINATNNVASFSQKFIKI